MSGGDAWCELRGWRQGDVTFSHRAPERLHEKALLGQVWKGDGILTGGAQVRTTMQEQSQRCGRGQVGSSGADVTHRARWLGPESNAPGVRVCDVAMCCGRACEGVLCVSVLCVCERVSV